MTTTLEDSLKKLRLPVPRIPVDHFQWVGSVLTGDSLFIPVAAYDGGVRYDQMVAPWQAVYDGVPCRGCLKVDVGQTTVPEGEKGAELLAKAVVEGLHNLELNFYKHVLLGEIKGYDHE